MLFATVRTLWTLVTLLIKLFCLLLKWKYIQDQTKIIPFWPLSGESETVLLKMFRPGHWAGVFHMGKILIPVTEILVAKTEISVTRPAQPSPAHIDIFTKKRVARRDLGNQASPVGGAHMKRPPVEHGGHIPPKAISPCSLGLIIYM